MARGSGNFARQLRSENKLWRVESLFQSGTFPPNITSAGQLPAGIPGNARKATLDAQRTFLASGVIFQTSPSSTSHSSPNPQANAAAIRNATRSEQQNYGALQNKHSASASTRSARPADPASRFVPAHATRAPGAGALSRTPPAAPADRSPLPPGKRKTARPFPPASPILPGGPEKMRRQRIPLPWVRNIDRKSVV